MTTDDTPTTGTIETPDAAPGAHAPAAETPAPEPDAPAPASDDPAEPTETPAPPADHAATHAAEMLPGDTPTETPAESAPDAAVQPAPTPAPHPEPEPHAEAATTLKKSRKPRAAPAPTAGADAAAILLGSSPAVEADEAEAEAEAVEADADEAADGDEADESGAVETPEGDAGADAAPAGEPVPENKKRWFAVKIQSGREESIKAAIERKVKIEGLEEFFGQIMIPVEEIIVKKKVKVKNKKTGETTTQEKNVTKYNKKFPGYLFAEVEFNNDILYVFRETSGVGDFVGVNTKKTAGAIERSAPAPMTEAEVQSMLTGAPDPNKKRGGKGGGKVVVKLDVEKGDKVRIRGGAFVGSEGEVKAISEPKDPTESPKVTVVVTFWGRPVDVEVDYWEVDKI
ncbi:transcription termination/antitermination protein NusG [Gemmata sp.]|uniref:transcription termination/antitermination protein NusG n=1 Tax=Gemmata sp. TaxID=1914242 RepID=UPI003F6F7A4C